MIRSMTLKIWGALGLMVFASWISWTMSLDSSSSAHASEQQADFIPLFDGKSLDGWEFDPVYWSVNEGAIVGEITAETLLKNNTFIIWKGGEVGDFELKVDYWISESGNSGVQYRSDRVKEVPFALRGYQADIDGGNRYTGQ
uniref:3-keto-disaccharide hydrolase n=1 Tax=Algoriphagus sp. TaxID=1872435 RepID=UPI0040473DDD